jgi:hypothetical protein
MNQDRKANVIDAIAEAVAAERLSAWQLLFRLLDELSQDQVEALAADVGITEKDIVEAEVGSTERKRWDDFLERLDDEWVDSDSDGMWHGEVEDVRLSHTEPGDLAGLPCYDAHGREFPSYEKYVESVLGGGEE